MEKIGVVIADDHEMVRNGVKKALDAQPDMEVLGMAADGAEAVERITALKPDIALIDIAMPRMNGLEVIQQIQSQDIDTRFVILSMHKSDAYIHQAITTGARGYVIKPSLTPYIIKAIRQVYAGEYFLSPRIKSRYIQEFLKNRMKLHEFPPRTAASPL